MRVLLVDDHRAIRLGVRSLLSMAEDIEVVGEAKDADEAVRLSAELKPDLVLLDLRLKGETGGIEVCRELKSSLSPPRVLIHSAHNAKEDLAMAILAGADGYLYKGAEHVDLEEAIRRTQAGEPVWLVDAQPDEARSRLVGDMKKARLTPKEREVCALMLKLRSNAEIARELYASVPTVKTHVSNVLRKLGMRNRRELF